jgi:hypothetical protein
MKLAITVVAFVASTAQAQTYPNNPFTNEAAALQAQLNACGTCGTAQAHTPAPQANHARVVSQVLTPAGMYVIVPNYTTGGTAAVIQVSRTARGK